MLARALFFAFIMMFAALPALPALAAQPVRAVTSPQGLTAWLIEDHATPMVTLQFAFRGGLEQDSAETQGLSGLFADMLTEGAGARDSAAYQQALADHGVSFGLDAGRDIISGTLVSLTAELPAATELAHDALTAPRFDDAALARVKQQRIGAIRARLADPDWQARRALFAALFAGHPYAYRSLGTEASVNSFTAAQLRAMLPQRLARDNLLIAAVGDITPDALGKLVDDVFGALPEKAALRPIAPVSAPEDGRSILIEHVSGQTVLLFAAPGIKRDDPDWHAASLLNYILGGGGFESRLMTEVRDKRGLTYGIDTTLSAMDATGLITGDAKTANAKAGEAWQVTREVWRKTYESGVTAAELQQAKDYLVGALPTSFTSSGAIAGMLLSLRKDHLPIDYLERRADLLRAVTQEEIARIAKRLLDPARLTLVAVGAPEGLDADREEKFVHE